MNLDKLWRQSLQDPKINKAITQTGVEIVRISIKSAIKYNILRLDSLELFDRDTEIFDHSDISDLVKVIRYDFKELLTGSHNFRSMRLNNLLRLCQDKAREIDEPREVVARIYQRGQRIRELVQLIETLIIYRNYAAHHSNERNDLGLSFKVASTLLRYTELLDLSSDWANDEQTLRNASIQVLFKIFEIDPTNEFQKNCRENTDDNPNLTATLEEISSKLDELAFNIKEAEMLKIKTNFTTSPIESEDLAFLESEKENWDYETIPEIITLAQLRQKLLEIRKQIAQRFQLTSDDQNILSEDIIAELILLGIQTKSGWQGLPSSSKIQINNSKICTEQLAEYWNSIEDTLKQFDWDSL